MKLFKKTKRMIMSELREFHPTADLVGHTCHNSIIGFAYFTVAFILLFITTGVIICMAAPTYKLCAAILANIVVFLCHSVYNWNIRSNVDGDVGTLCNPNK